MSFVLKESQLNITSEYDTASQEEKQENSELSDHNEPTS
jgi:hypothetical protein